MWHHQPIAHRVIEEEGEEFGEHNFNNPSYLLQRNRQSARPAVSGNLLHGSASQVSLSFGSQRSIVGSGRSLSLGYDMNMKRVGMDDFNKTNETFPLGTHFSPPSVPPRGGRNNNNLAQFAQLFAALPAGPIAAAPPPGFPVPSQQRGIGVTLSSAPALTSADPDGQDGCSSIHAASVSSEEDARDRTTTPSSSPVATVLPVTTGPSELYRLIASAPPPGGDPPGYWDVVLRRANDHPQEACFYDPSAGGHVYALHRLLRRTDDDDDDDDDDDGEEGRGDHLGRRRPPVSVVEAVMRACPRAVTRKQAVVDEDALLVPSSSSPTSQVTTGHGRDDGNVLHRASPPLHPPPPPPLPAVAAVGEANHRRLDDVDDGEGRPGDDVDVDVDADSNAERDDVRFEYPLAIACECRHDGEVVRLLASYLGAAAPAYRSEVYRSLDYASLPNHVVRILLEEHAGCVVERGTNSEATEGDDDDCPLEQVLFWWDDPDMMGMEEEILSYPNCDMGEDLRDLWEKLRMMLYAATNGTMAGYDNSKGSFQVLHRLLRVVSSGGIGGVRFPNDFAHAVLLLAKFIQRERKSMFEERDEAGSLPLHIAVSGDSLLRQIDPSRMTVAGRDEERAEDGSAVENDAQMDQAMDGVVRADDGDLLAAGGEARQLNNGPLPPQAGGLLPRAELAEEDEDDEGDSESDDNADEDNDKHTSAMPTDMEIIRLLLDQYPASIRLRDSQSGSLPIHLILRHNPRAIDAIELFLDLYPRSLTMPDGDGRLPIHLAILQKSPMWNKVVSMSPISLEARDPVTGLLPFQLAAMSKPALKDDLEEPTSTDDEVELESLSTCYSLLRMSPCLASGLADIKPRPQSLIEQQIMVWYKPRVTKLEEENERLRQKVEELEHKLASMLMAETGDLAILSGCPHLKKRKSSVAG
ncbi:hypothetical protein ACHAW5_009233 [Stephanodiscus triporus]|uniref:Uncharacterized protein n=1 Tax=Stephanodiscus triporus TaxID=2934178 RepID=A0ABD3PGJ3_9STRA